MFANLGQVFTRSFAAARISKYRTFTHLRRWGLSYGKVQIYRDYDKYWELFRKVEKLKFVPKHYRPTQRLFVESETMMTKRFKYGVRVDIFDYRTNEVRSELRYIRSMSQLQVRTMEREAIKGMEAGKRAGYYDIVGYRLEEAWHSAGERW